jgi:hypothetical protein
MTVGAMGMTLGGAMAAFVVFALNRVTERRATMVADEENASLSRHELIGPLTMIIAAGISFLTLTLNAVLTGVVLLTERQSPQTWMKWSLALHWFAIVVIATPVFRLITIEARRALRAGNVASSPIVWLLRRVPHFHKAMFGVIPTLVIGCAAASKFGSGFDRSLAIIIGVPTIGGLTVSLIGFFGVTRGVVRAENEGTAVMILAVSDHGRVALKQYQGEKGETKWGWILPRTKLQSGDADTLDAANRLLDELFPDHDGLRLMHPVATGRSSQMQQLLDESEMPGFVKLEVYEAVSKNRGPILEEVPFGQKIDGRNVSLEWKNFEELPVIRVRDDVLEFLTALKKDQWKLTYWKRTGHAVHCLKWLTQAKDMSHVKLDPEPHATVHQLPQK